MASKSSMHLIVDPKDMECGVCLQPYSHKTNQAMILLCGHSICSACLPSLSSCPHCRQAINGPPAKNILVSSLIEKDSQTKRCSIHEKSKDFFSKKTKRLICSDCFLEENQEEYKSVQDIKLKVQEIKDQQEKIHQKKDETKTKIKEVLGKRSTNLLEWADTVLDEELAYLFSLKKKIKTMVMSTSFLDENSSEHALSVEDLSKYEEQNKQILGKWDKDPDEGELVAKILEVPSQIKSYIEKYDDKKKKILKDFVEEEKVLREIIQDSKYDIDLRIKNSKKLLNKLDSTSQKLNSAHSWKVAKDYLFDTFKDYGFKATNQDYSILLEECTSCWKNHFNQFHPKFFECSLEGLQLICGYLSDFKFSVLCDILQNVKKLSDLKMTFEKISTKQAESLANFILKSTSLQKFSTKMPHLNSFRRFAEKAFPVKKFSSIIIHSNKAGTLIDFQQNLKEPNETLQECNMKFSGLRKDFDEATKILLPHLESFRLIKILRLSFGENITYRNSLSSILSLANLTSLKELDLGFANTLQFTDSTHQIARLIFASKSLLKVSLFLGGEAVSDEKVFDGLFAFQGPSVDHQLEEFSLTVMRSDEIDLKKMVSFLGNFSKLKRLDLTMNEVYLSFNQIIDLLKETHHLKSLGSLKVVVRGVGEFSPEQNKEIAECLKGLFFQQKSVVFEKLLSHHIPDYVDFDSDYSDPDSD